MTKRESAYFRRQKAMNPAGELPVIAVPKRDLKSAIEHLTEQWQAMSPDEKKKVIDFYTNDPGLFPGRPIQLSKEDSPDSIVSY